jgi:hypothetical protein
MLPLPGASLFLGGASSRDCGDRRKRVQVALQAVFGWRLPGIFDMRFRLQADTSRLISVAPRKENAVTPWRFPFMKRWAQELTLP